MQNKTFSTLFIAQNLIQLSAVDSTNNYLKLMLSKSEPLAEGTVILADDQFAGRGQQGNTWISQAGLNLTFSIYLRPSFLSIVHQFQLNTAVSVGLVNALKHYVSEGIKIKWPNDIYFHNYKIGGVLIENTISSGNLRSSIIGIGVNVNQREFNRSLVKVASSIGRILHADVDLLELLEKICHSIEVQYLKLRAGKSKDQLKDYLENLYQFGKASNFKSDNKIFEGYIVGVSEEGKLLVDHGGQQCSYGFKEIEFLDNN
ncbi:biotin--[acetyl-CoA-carboxylase] ligase [Pedobacter sp. JCM 36344]|uniref:biotin--[acetyl-CoA-carboxylase] ligase n=1 Tax=Pedobacter sp. JCM 36344 TaxID=3374280 RepID=UPI00397ABFC9